MSSRQFKIIDNKYLMLESRDNIYFTFIINDYKEFNITMDVDKNTESNVKLATTVLNEIEINFKDGAHKVELTNDISEMLFHTNHSKITYDEFMDKIMIDKL